MGLQIVGKATLIVCIISMSPFIIMCILGAPMVDVKKWLQLPDPSVFEEADIDLQAIAAENDVFNCVAIGLSRTNFQSESMMPGWDAKSYGYHSDDGCVFHGAGVKVRFYGPSFDVGDTVGCGIDYARCEIFFTLNGHYLGAAFNDVSGILAPTIGIDSLYPVLINFGSQPFQFDLQKYMDDHNHAELICDLMEF